MSFLNIFRTSLSTVEIIEANETPKMSPAVPPMSDMNSNRVYSGDSVSVKIVSALNEPYFLASVKYAYLIEQH